MNDELFNIKVSTGILLFALILSLVLYNNSPCARQTHCIKSSDVLSKHLVRKINNKETIALGDLCDFSKDSMSSTEIALFVIIYLLYIVGIVYNVSIAIVEYNPGIQVLSIVYTILCVLGIGITGFANNVCMDPSCNTNNCKMTANLEGSNKIIVLVVGSLLMTIVFIGVILTYYFGFRL